MGGKGKVGISVSFISMDGLERGVGGIFWRSCGMRYCCFLEVVYRYRRVLVCVCLYVCTCVCCVRLCLRFLCSVVF